MFFSLVGRFAEYLFALEAHRGCGQPTVSNPDRPNGIESDSSDPYPVTLAINNLPSYDRRTGLVFAVGSDSLSTTSTINCSDKTSTTRTDLAELTKMSNTYNKQFFYVQC